MIKIDNLNKTLSTQHILYVEKPYSKLYSSNSSNTYYYYSHVHLKVIRSF